MTPRSAALGLGGALAAMGVVPAACPAENVLILSSTDPVLDAQVQAVMQAAGHTATVGPSFTAFNGSTSLVGYDVVYLQANVNWNTGDMPVAGQLQLVDFVARGGGLVTSEWTTWLSAFVFMEPVLPTTPTGAFTNATTPVTYTVVTPDPIMTAGLPSFFAFAVTSYSGTESQLVARAGATVFCRTSTWTGAAGAAGWGYGLGRAASVSVCAGPNSLNDANFARLLGNAVTWVGADALGCGCACDYDASTGVGVCDFFDFIIFQDLFAASDPCACELDPTTGQGVCDFFDFVAFQDAFAAGC